MAELTHAQAIECFHLAFLNVLPSHLRRENYVLKGGANLRYFYRSHRYSEDIDFDLVSGEGWKLADHVDAVLAAKALELLLRQHGLSVSNINKAKQTDTTRRWKLLLAVPGHAQALSTKIEFSIRNGDDRFDIEPVDENVVKPYGLLRPSLQRYRTEPATEQKIGALAQRSETQARDVFDLDWLFRTQGGTVEADRVKPELIEKAAHRCLELTYDAYRGQVVPFLEPEVASIYGGEEAWNQMQSAVLEELIRLSARD